MEKRSKEYFRGCLLGGAIGDALGWPVEFLKLNEIKKKYGEDGITDLVAGINGKAEITDDTQMTLFTAEGLLRAENRGRKKGICHIPSVVYYAYLRGGCILRVILNTRITIRFMMDGF
jgi:ADP-ribosylglycohydrolase